MSAKRTDGALMTRPWSHNVVVVCPRLFKMVAGLFENQPCPSLRNYQKEPTGPFVCWLYSGSRSCLKWNQGAFTWPKSERQKKLKSNASERRRKIILKSGPPPVLRAVATSEKEEAEVPQARTPHDIFEGIKGRRPKSDRELNEWLATDEGKAATIFEPISLSRWGETGRS